jgi:hypothetical protein
MKNGMWEMKVFANKVPLLFCVTDTTRSMVLSNARVHEASAQDRER